MVFFLWEMLLMMITGLITANRSVDHNYDKLRPNQSMTPEKVIAQKSQKNILLILKLKHKQPLLFQIQI